MYAMMALISFLTYCLVLPSYLVHALPVDSSGSTQCSKSKVLILGAGMAGASAGKALTEQGIHEFKIIEYQDRVGGRTLHTSFGTGGPNGSAWTVELGTNWITGLHKPANRDKGMVNPVWTLAQAVNLTTVPANNESGLFYDQNGPNDWSSAFKEYNKAQGRMATLANDRVKHGEQDTSAHVGLQLVGWDPTNDMYKQAAEAAVWDFDAATTTEVSSMIFGIIGVETSEGKILGQFQRFVLDQRGYDIVTKYLASEYLQPDDNRLVLGTPVTDVAYSDSEVTIHTANNTCYTADYAICTFSLGVLQQSINGKAPVSFSPAFPSWKAESVFGNIMGIYTKIFYQFDPDEVFWDRKVQNFYYASPYEKGFWSVWESLDFPGSPLEGSGIFFATNTWEQSMQIEKMSDNEVMKQGMGILRQMFPNTTIPEPKAFTFQRWGMTPWIYGSYSNWAAGYTLEQQTNFRANLGRLWFAGEATSPEFYGYLHGAFYEGKFAAEEVAACINGDNTCADRERHVHLEGDPEDDYNESTGFQNPIAKILNAYERR